ncbi:ATP-binding protein [Synechocystis sp. LEGE 06083]|uniref:ATP-binding protein n=1 Tax=Synechocystis sp. LEGE 06083 TaxID=915336 RepID=UPI00187EF2DA|nr:ATP-binding protein [Synechocystis sp. LEGE 06083]MBE9195801.1 ATP-binding protein [Synechocystis sp. LEGE 06083]
MDANLVGTVISDTETPTFETVRIKLKAGRDVKPGVIVKMWMQREESSILFARIRGGYEKNPNKNPDRISVEDALGLKSPHISEELSTDIYRLVEADLIGELINGSIRSPENLPNSGADVYIADSTEIVNVLGLIDEQENGLYIGDTIGGLKTKIVLKKESIQRHFFIGGTTGSGKSYAMGVVAEELLKQFLPIIFIDTQDEYSKFVEAHNGKVVKPGLDFTVRISSLTEEEFIKLLPEITQKNSLHSEVAGRAFDNLKTRLVNRDIQKFGVPDIQQEINTTAVDLSSKPGDAPRLAEAVQRKLNSLANDPMFGDGVNWREYMHPCLAINCKNMTSKQLQTLATVILRELQSLRLRGHIPPYVVVVDEAHLFVPQGETSPCKQILLEGVRIGRHHGICMVLMTQSPVDIDKSVIRQCNTRMIFALEPDQLEAIKGVKSDASDEMLRALPKMPRGTCLLSGTYESIKHTIPVKIRERYTEDSEGGKTPDIFAEMNDKWIDEIEKLK